MLLLVLTNVKIQFTLEEAKKIQRDSICIRSTLSSTLELDGGGWSTPRPGRFTPGKDSIPAVYEAG